MAMYPTNEIEDARPHQRELMLERIARTMNGMGDIQASYSEDRKGGIDLFQGSDRIGWIYMRVTIEEA